jgi:hypothetical protein
VTKDFERFSVYGFSIDYPRVCRVEFNPKSRREAGDVVFHFPDRVKTFLSWGELEKATKNFQTVEKHAEHSLDTVKKSGNVKNFVRVSHDSITVNSHTGAFNRVKLDEVAVGFFTGKRAAPRETYSVHVHCPESGRYFVVYTMIPSNSEGEYGAALTKMANSLKCH